MKPSKRLEFLESDPSLPPQTKVEDLEPLDPTVHFPLLARYDFAGKGPRPGCDADARMYGMASGLQTRGEKIVPILTRMGWALVRLVIGLFILYVILRGNEFNCGFARLNFR